MKVKLLLPLFFLVIVLFSLSLAAKVAAQSGVLAFPGAVGHGAKTIGGRGGTIYEVDTTEDVVNPNDGKTSLREAVEASGPRIIIFKTGGNFVLKNILEIKNSHLTIAGESAPGGGVTIIGEVNINNTSQVIIRHVRVRLHNWTKTIADLWASSGYATQLSKVSNAEAIFVERSSDVILDHVTASWGIDETMQVGGAYQDWTYRFGNITIQNSLIAQGMDNAGHDEETHSKGLFIGYNIRNVTLFGNLMTANRDRNPFITGVPQMEMINNISSYFNIPPMFTARDGDTELCFVGNSIISSDRNPLTNTQKLRVLQTLTTAYPFKIQLFLKNNLGITRPDNSYAETAICYSNECEQNVSYQMLQNQPFSHCKTPSMDANVARSYVKQNVGAFPRDSVDSAIINAAIPSSGFDNGQGVIPDGRIQTSDGKFLFNTVQWPSLPNIDPGTGYTDTDHDGMSNEWEIQNGLNPNNSSDGNQDKDGDGWTNVEEFLHYLADNLAATAPEISGTPSPTPTQSISISPTATATPIENSVINNFIVNDGQTWRVVSPPTTGDLVYTDRTFTFVNLPQEFASGHWIQTAMSSKTSTQNPLASFNLSQAADIYVGIDLGRIPEGLSWLSGWTQTSLVADSTDYDLTFFKNSFDAGTTINLGSQNKGGNTSMYTVFIVPNESSEHCSEDIDQDGIVDLTDYSILTSNFFQSNPAVSRADINGDGVVDLTDYSRLVTNYLTVCN